VTPDEMDTQTGADRDPSGAGADRDPLEDRRDCHDASLNMTRLLIRQNHILREIAGERERQDSLWGIQHHPDGTKPVPYGDLAETYRRSCDIAARENRVTWRHILFEEAFEAFAETEPAKLRKELLQVAAVVVAWIEDIDQR